MTVTRHTGHVLDVVRTLPDASVDLVATSPPFLALRDYNGLEGQWGSEASPAEFLDHLLELAVELRRVLAPHGSLALELGDTYSGSGGGGGDYHPGGLREGQIGFAGSAAARDRGAEHWRQKQVARGAWPLPKSLCLIPTLFPACLAYGRNLLDPTAEPFDPWRVRNLIAWARNNPPVGALGDKVRPATSYITVACTSERRWFDLDAVRTPSDYSRPNLNGCREVPGQRPNMAAHTVNPAGSPPLDHWWDEPDGDLVWLINTQGSSLSHYAMWPPKLAERLVLSMCPAEVCRVCGEPRRRIVAVEPSPFAPAERTAERALGRQAVAANGRTHMGIRRQAATLGWSDCGHGNDWRPGVVLDPFSGAGTTLAVADIHGRDAIGIDLDPANAGLYEQRYEQCWKALGRAGTSPVTEHGEQLALAVQS